jgi:hypothetical protein
MKKLYFTQLLFHFTKFGEKNYFKTYSLLPAVGQIKLGRSSLQSVSG